MTTPILKNDLDSGPSETGIRIERLSQAEWSGLTPTMCGYSYRQAWAFGIAAASRVGATSEHVGIFSGEQCIGAADVRVRRIPLLGGGIAYVSGGPLVVQGAWETVENAIENTLESLIHEYVDRRGMVLRIVPPIEWAAERWDVKPLFDRLAFESPEVNKRYRTILIDLTPSLDQLRKNLDQKWRNCLNRAEKNGLTVRSGDAVELFDSFDELHQELIDRKGFDIDLSVEFYRDVQSRMDVSDKLYVKLVEVDGKPIAGHVGSVLGQTSVYLLGASNHDGNEQKASYLMQWMTIVEARNRGCKWYDLGGIDPEGNPGVYRFKERMGGFDITGDGPYELRPSGMRSQVSHWAEKLYRAVKRRRI